MPPLKVAPPVPVDPFDDHPAHDPPPPPVYPPDDGLPAAFAPNEAPPLPPAADATVVPAAETKDEVPPSRPGFGDDGDTAPPAPTVMVYDALMPLLIVPVTT